MRLIKLILFGLSVLLVGWLFYKNLVPSGRFEAVYNFQNTPFVSALRPPERLNQVNRFQVSGFRFQEIIGDPVYFDLHLPSSFEDIEVLVRYKNSPRQEFTISAFTDRKNWKFRKAELETVDLGGGALESRARFSTAGLDIARRTITFILGAPAATPENPVTIDEIKIIAAKEPIPWRLLPAKVIKILNSIF